MQPMHEVEAPAYQAPYFYSYQPARGDMSLVADASLVASVSPRKNPNAPRWRLEGENIYNRPISVWISLIQDKIYDRRRQERMNNWQPIPLRAGEAVHLRIAKQYAAEEYKLAMEACDEAREKVPEEEKGNPDYAPLRTVQECVDDSYYHYLCYLVITHEAVGDVEAVLQRPLWPVEPSVMRGQQSTYAPGTCLYVV